MNTRREHLKTSACGIGSLALASIQSQLSGAGGTSSLAPLPTLIPQRAKRVIFLFMAGGPSHVDSFDYKPELIKQHGKSIDFTGVRTGTFGKKSQRKLMKPLWEFSRHGACGQHVSTLFPHIAQHVDDLCFIKSMHTEGVAHGPSTLFLHTGATNLVRPSMGSWISYGLGTENTNLPAFISIAPSAGKGGPRNYGNAFLPALHQGTAIGRAGSVEKAQIRNIENALLKDTQRRSRFDLLQKLNADQAAQAQADDRLDATIQSYELAWRMQMEVPELTDLSKESAYTKSLYGIGEKHTEFYGRQCLLARRMVENGVRFVSVNY